MVFGYFWSDLLKKIGIRNRPYLDYEEVEEDLQKRLQMPAGVTMRVNRQGTPRRSCC